MLHSSSILLGWWFYPPSAFWWENGGANMNTHIIYIYTYIHKSGIGIINHVWCNHNFSMFILDGSFWFAVFRLQYHWVTAHCWFNIQTQGFTVSERHARGFKSLLWKGYSKALEVLSHIISGKTNKSNWKIPQGWDVSYRSIKRTQSSPWKTPQGKRFIK